jgi:UDP-2,3-diacylglucosamine pyrophosphatase LpxH
VTDRSAEPAVATAVSPILPLTAEEERRLLDRLLASPPAAILAVSDLHLGEGLEPGTGRYFRRENFFADAAFGRFLERQAAMCGTPAMLVLDGDIFDFLRIDKAPKDKDEAAFQDWRTALERLGVRYSVDDLRRRVLPHERTFGLQTDDYKSVFKFGVIARGHPAFFRALAAWVGRGGAVLYVRGNHDVEQYWPLVRRAFRDEIHRAGADAAAVSRLVAFADEAATIENVYVEHGHGYEAITRVVGPATLSEPAGQLNLPLGSFVNRYIINRMERIEPFLDNIKPVTDVLWAMARRRPLLVFGIIRRGTRFLARALVKRRARHALLAVAIVGIALTQLVPLAVVAAIVLFFAWPAFREWLVALPVIGSPTVRTLLSATGMALPFLIAMAKELFSHRPAVGEDAFAEGLYGALRRRFAGAAPWRTVYGVLGHTHVQDVQELPPVAPGAGRTLYVNTGTWVPLWPKDRPDLAGRVFYTFVRFTRRSGEYAHESLVWDDILGDARPAQMLTPDRRPD